MAAVFNTVSGSIFDIFNVPLANVTVQVFDKDLRSEQLLGAAVSDAKGFYTVRFEPAKFAGSEAKGADLFIRVVVFIGTTGTAPLTQVLGESPVYFNVPQNFTLDFKIGNAPIKELNEFDALVQHIKPLTEPQQVAIADLQETDKFKDISFLANETGEDVDKIALLPIAFTLSGKTKIAPDIFYGLFRVQFPTNLNALLLIHSDSIAKAIKTAVNENIISAKWANQVDKVVQAFNQLATSSLVSGVDNNSAAFQQVLGAVVPKPEQQQAFVAVYFANEATPEKFWNALSEQAAFVDPKVIADIQSVLKLNLLTNNLPALTSLLFQQQQQNPALNDIRGFASFTVDDWHARTAKLVASGNITSFPDGIPGNSLDEKAVNYANATAQLIKTLYPTDVFASQLGKDNGSAFKPSQNDLTTFFANNVDYDLKNNSIDKVLAVADLTGVTDQGLLKKELKTINRLYKISDEYSHVNALRLEGLDSATAIVNNYTPTQFTTKFANSISAESAAAIYQKAQRIDNRATVLAMGLKLSNDVSINAINGPGNNAHSDYVSMFGDSNCQCEQCQSVYSPSAYLVDILNLLKNRSAAFPSLTHSRRPDLTQILLTCKNTNTPLPYIDLVNEMLENTIAPVPAIVVNGVNTYPQYQTNNSAEELLAYPEHENAAAYAKLKLADSAYNLPLNLPLKETRLYLDKLGVKRHELMELYFRKQAGTKYSDLNIAIEYLGLSQQELAIVNGTNPKPVALGSMTDFLHDTGLTYIEALKLLECYFVNQLVNGERSIKIVSTSTTYPASCKLSDLMLQTTLSQSLNINPFIRLWKKTTWDILELDRAFTALGVKELTGDINSTLIVPLSQIARLKDRLNLTVSNVISLWADIDTGVYFDHAAEGQPQVISLYDSIFKNKLVTNPIDPDLSDPAGLSGMLANKSDLIIAALNLSQKGFDALLNTPSIVDGKLTLPNLSVLHRYGLLAKTLKLSVDDFISVIDLYSPLSFKPDVEFFDVVAFIRSSGFTIAELKSLLKPNATITAAVDINGVATVLTSIREGLKKIELLDLVGKTPVEQAAHKLQIQNSFIVEVIGTAFKIESNVANVLFNTLVKSVADNTKPAITPFITAAFIGSDTPLSSADFSDLFNTYILLGDTWSRIAKLLTRLKLTLDEFIYFQSHETTFQINGIWNLPVDNSYPAFANLSNLLRFRKALALPKLNWFKLFDSAILNVADPKSTFITSLAGLSNLSTGTLEALLGKGAVVNDVGVLQYAFPTDYLNGAALSAVIDCANMAAKLGADVASVQLLSQPPASIDETTAAIAKSLLKSKYDVTTWLNVVTPISNQLRVMKRDALTSYILTATAMQGFRDTNHLTDVNSLFGYFLIDLQMEACMLTSRIKQAISSTQLFVDRCLMNLEPGISLSAEFATQWDTWRKRYRVWEANRKIFLYPENWIEPDLRDDKSPFFKELESALKQNDITDQTAEDALHAYLEKLDTVANLEMVGVYPDNLTGIVHVIGRTRNIPHQYYYTKQVASVWSAWEKVDVDIEGDHILPVVWNNRLMLFWAQFTEKEQQDPEGFTVPAATDKIAPNPKYLEIKLAWSEYKNTKWMPKKISKDVFSTGAIALSNFNPKMQHISLSSYIEAEKLYLRMFIHLTTNVATNIIRGFGGFVFDGCHGTPLVYSTNTVPFLYTPHGLESNEMFLIERPDHDILSVSDTGIYKAIPPYYAPTETAIFGNTPGGYLLLPNHHEIEKIQNEYFFYNNGHNNFYVHSIRGFVRPPLNDVAVLAQGNAVGRKVVEPSLVTGSPLLNSKINISGISEAASTAFGDAEATGLMTTSPTFPSIYVGKHYSFQTFYHPYVCELIKTLNTFGIDGLYKNTIVDFDGSKMVDGIQNRAAQNIFVKDGAYAPTPVVQTPWPKEQVDFSFSGVYAIYNWELFFHIPLLIATRLSQNQKFEESRKWFHYIFDPTRSSTASGPERFWLTKPFKDEIGKKDLSIENLLNSASAELDLQLTHWENNPFNPHAVARLRISAYMRSTVMKYIDNLIAWGDQLFQQDTIETINEATLLYVLAANMLGEKPPLIPTRAIPTENSYSTIQDNLDSFSNAKVLIQSFFSLSDSNNGGLIDSIPMSLFCIPPNDLLLGYWDTVADRLFKIRHCLNIDGVFQQLPLFEPPIDPALLVKAAAAGLNLSSVLMDMNASLPYYRFQVILQKANELCNDVKGLGSELLAALEKKDAEHLALLRSSHELSLLAAVRDIKASQVDEATQNWDSLKSSKAVIQAKRDYFDSRDFTNVFEELYLLSMPTAMIFQNMQIASQGLASAGYSAPEVTIGPFSSGTTYGGDNIGNSLSVAAAGFGQKANLFNTISSIAKTLGEFFRRRDDWNFQTQTADLELQQIDKQIAAAEIRLAIAENELRNHDLQIAQSQEVDEFLSNKFSNEELYDHMVGQLSTVYFQSYKLAYNTARKAEKCLQFELGVDNTSFINFGYWDNLKKGLLSGEKLQYDLRRLETAYLEQNRREFELTKHISLLQLDPLELVKLRETGLCKIDLPEEIFDLDYPGHYFRRIKSVSITLPCVIGPYTTISCTLRLLKNSIRTTPHVSDVNDYPRKTEDKRFVENHVAVESIAASNAQNDSGVFELSFRDERYLPFEGAGVISQWSLELFNDAEQLDFGKSLRQFDYGTISDTILHVKYTAREDAGLFKSAAISHLRDYLRQVGGMPSLRLFNLRQEFPTQWHRFLNPPNSTSGNLFELELIPSLFRILDSGKTLKVNTIWLLANCTDVNNNYNIVLTTPDDSDSLTLAKPPNQFGSLHVAIKSSQDSPPLNITINSSTPPVKWKLQMTRSDGGNLQEDPVKKVIEVEDFFLVIGYEWE
jgi:hypothetical protein